MKYMVMIYGNKDLWRSFPPEVAKEAIDNVNAFNQRYFGTANSCPRTAWRTNSRPRRHVSEAACPP
jgi:hypothetical protein